MTNGIQCGALYIFEKIQEHRVFQRLACSRECDGEVFIFFSSTGELSGGFVSLACFRFHYFSPFVLLGFNAFCVWLLRGGAR
jgi:hypothetical protein